MKKLTFSLFVMLFMGSMTLIAQDSVEKMVKNADKALSSFSKDPIGNTAKLTEAADLIKQVMATDEGNGYAKAHLVAAKMYIGQMTTDQNAKILDPNHTPQYALSAPEASHALQKAYALGADDKKIKSKIVDNIYQGFGLMNEAGYALYQSEDYAGSAQTFSGMLDLLNVLEKEGEKSPFATPETDVPNLKYMAGVTSMFGGDTEKAASYLTELMEANYDEPGVYSSLFSLYENDNPEKAGMVLEAGRKRYPEDVSLLFSEINYYLKRGELEKLIGKLEAAKAAEPGNASIYLTLGNVYDQLHASAEDPAQKEEYFNKALAEYNQAAEVDPASADAHYSVGALYFNQAAEVSTAMNELPLSAQKEYDALKAKFDGLMDSAEPHFKMAEKVNPSDLNTLIALKELYATKQNYELSTEFKNRLEKVQAGEKIETSYFK